MGFEGGIGVCQAEKGEIGVQNSNTTNAQKGLMHLGWVRSSQWVEHRVCAGVMSL